MSVKSVKTKNRTKKRKKEEKTVYPGIYVSKSGKYFIRQRLRLPDGSIIQPRKTFDTLTEAILQKEMIKEGSSNLIEKYDLTVKEVCELYIQFKSLKSEDVKSTTIYDLESSFKKRVLPFFGNMKINKITPAIINEWKEWLVEKGYAFNTRKNTFTNTKAMFEHAVKYYSLAKNPFDQVNSFKEIVITLDEKFRYYTHDQFLVFVDNAEDESPYRPYKLMFEFDFYLGLRNGEAQSFFFTDVDWVNETIKVYKNLLKVPKKYHLAKPRNEEYLTLTTAWQKANLKDWELIDRPKNNKSVRIVDISGYLIKRLRALYEWCKKEVPGFRDDCYIFGLFEPIPRSTITRKFKKYIKKAGLPEITLHELRHSHATHLIYLGFSLFDVAKRLGHSNIQELMDTYGHLLPNTQKNMSNKIAFERENLLKK